MAYNTAEISQLLTKQAALNKALGEAREKETRLALIEIVQKMREYDISLYELIGRKPGEQPSDVQPKYRDPDTGATWSGRGLRAAMDRWEGSRAIPHRQSRLFEPARPRDIAS
ncbi:H-NS histone family protein [Caballeronia sp. PC1]|uniref:H-NS histone family protein n=1 Tax=unclassified Caballeronia TaxID=2646786 RepID=UPI0035C7D48E